MTWASTASRPASSRAAICEPIGRRRWASTTDSTDTAGVGSRNDLSGGGRPIVGKFESQGLGDGAHAQSVGDVQLPPDVGEELGVFVPAAHTHGGEQLSRIALLCLLRADLKGERPANHQGVEVCLETFLEIVQRTPFAIGFREQGVAQMVERRRLFQMLGVESDLKFSTALRHRRSGSCRAGLSTHVENDEIVRASPKQEVGTP